MTGSAYAGQLACSTASPEDTLERSVKANPRLQDFQVKYLPASSLSVAGGNAHPRASFSYGRKPPVAAKRATLDSRRPTFSIAPSAQRSCTWWPRTSRQFVQLA